MFLKRYRLVSEAFRQIYGDKLAGMFMDEIDLGHVIAACVGEYHVCVRARRPVARSGSSPSSAAATSTTDG